MLVERLVIAGLNTSMSESKGEKMLNKFCLVIWLAANVVATVLSCENKNCILPHDLTKKTRNTTNTKNLFDLKRISSKEGVVPIVVLGAGPGGLSAGLYGAAQFDTVVLAGEQPSLLTETSYVENWVGAPHQLGADLVQKSREQAEAAGARIIDATVKKVDLTSWPFAISLDDGKTIHALALIIATGARPRLLGIPGEKNYWARGVSACARCDALFYKNKKVVVVGGGDAAIEEAIELARYAKEVTILHRRSQLRAANSMQTRLRSYSQIHLLYDISVKEIIGDKKKVTGIKISHVQTGKTEILPIDGIFLAIGHQPNTDLFKDILETDNSGYLMLQCNTQQTSLPGVFAAGDVAAPRYRQAIIAAGDGAKAGRDAIEFLESIGFTLAEANQLRAITREESKQDQQESKAESQP